MGQRQHSLRQWHGSLWADACPAMDSNSSLQDEIRADVCIIGAGFTGLRAALALVAAGSNVVVLDAADVGWGASGRNGGQVNPMLPFNSPEQLRALLGPRYFERLTEASLNSADELFALIKEHNIDCQARQHGWLRVLHSAQARRKAKADVKQWNAFGAGMSLVEGDELIAMSGTAAYSSGVLAPRGGLVQPMLLSQGLARAGGKLGARYFAQSRVAELSREGKQWRTLTASGSVTSDWVIVATNAYSDNLVAGLRQSIIPLTPIQIASERLPDSQIGDILPQGHSISDSRRVIMYARREPDNRIVFGGLGNHRQREDFSGFQWLKKDAERVFPQLKGIRWTHHWGGHIAVTEDHLPHLHEPQPGLLIGLGYNGRGVAMSNIMGRVLAERALGASPDSLIFPTTPVQGTPLRTIKLLGMKPAIATMRLLDQLETHR